LAGSYKKLIESAVTTPEKGIGRLNILTEDERELLINGLNNTKKVPSTNTPVHELIAQQARRRPDAVAVVSRQRQLSYGELAGRPGAGDGRGAERGGRRGARPGRGGLATGGAFVHPE